MKRKKKFPKMKRALPLALVVVMMMTMFVVSASAMTFEESGVCDHGLFVVYAKDNARAPYMLGEMTFTCDLCSKTYNVTYVPSESCFESGAFKDYLMFNLTSFPNPNDGGESMLLGVDCCGSRDGVNVDDGGYYVEVLTLTIDGVGSSDSMVGEMTDTITTSFGGMLKGVGASIVNFFDKTVIAENGGLTTLATWTLVFLGIGFGFMVVKFITNKVRKK